MQKSDVVMGKSYVGVGHELCPVCLKEHSETVLLNTRLRKTLTTGMVTGWSMCPEHKKLRDDGYVACVEVSNKSEPTLQTAVRTGAIAHIKAEAWGKIFNVAVPESRLAFLQEGCIDILKSLQKGA